MEAATHISSLLEEVGYNLGKFTEQHPGSTISYGSEFFSVGPNRTHSATPSNLGACQNKPHQRNQIPHQQNRQRREDRITILHSTIERGNHMSALSNEQRPHVTKLVIQDIELGYAIPLSVECLKDIPEAKVYQIGCQDQLTTNQKEKIIPKKRVTNGLSYDRRDDLPVNQRVCRDDMLEVIFGFTLIIFLHLIHHIRWTYPNKRILCNKTMPRKPIESSTLQPPSH